MKNLKRLLSACVLIGIGAGCAHLPDATVGYYLAETGVRFKVIRTVACDKQKMLVVANSATPAVTHSADRKQLMPLRFAGLKGTFWDTDIKFDFYEDGRLKGINSVSTGQGETILKTVVSVATAFKLLQEGARPVGFDKECELIQKASGDKPLTLTYEGEVNVSGGPSGNQAIPAETTSSFYAKELESAIGTVCAVVGKTAVPDAPVSYKAQEGDVLLAARQPGLVEIKIRAGSNCNADPVWDGKLPVAQLGRPYVIPIPAPAAFGKQTFNASFAESGALNSLQYATAGGAGQGLNVLNSALTALQGQTAAQKAAEVKAEADLIAQQQRLVQCRANPEACK